MLYALQGTVTKIFENSIILQSGLLFFELQTIHATSYEKNSSLTLFVHMHWNNEQGPSFYGFRTTLDRSVFIVLKSCSGIGPKTALQILHHIDASALCAFIQSEEYEKISAVKGIGEKKAKKLCLEVKKSIEKIMLSEDVTESSSTHILSQLQETLSSLHYSSKEIYTAMQAIKKESPASFDDALKKALLLLSQQTI